jgi:hypothetical protein
MQAKIEAMGLEEFIQNFVVDLPFNVNWPPRPLEQVETNSTENASQVEDSTGEKRPLLNVDYTSHYLPPSI